MEAIWPCVDEVLLLESSRVVVSADASPLEEPPPLNLFVFVFFFAGPGRCAGTVANGNGWLPPRTMAAAPSFCIPRVSMRI